METKVIWFIHGSVTSTNPSQNPVLGRHLWGVDLCLPLDCQPQEGSPRVWPRADGNKIDA